MSLEDAQLGIISINWAKREFTLEGLTPCDELSVEEVLARLREAAPPDVEVNALVLWPDVEHGLAQIELYGLNQLEKLVGPETVTANLSD